jgi:DNA replication and repair protein RecF
LKLDRFRNYPSLDLAGDGRHVVLTGDNGAGKTNLLEALSFLSPGRGLRRAPYDRVAMAQPVEGFSAPGTWTVHAVVEGALGEAQIGTGLQAGPTGVESQRRIRVNSTPVPRAEVLLDHSRIVWLTPAMDGLFTGSASERRRFLDRMVLAIDPTHGRRVADFERAMRSRNRLLEDYGADPSWLTGVERQMAELGTAIAFARSELVSLLTGIVDGKPDAAFPKAELALEGTLEASLAAQGSGKAADLEDNYATLLARNRAQDRGAGRTLEGPHRTNLAVRHGPKAMDAALCSTGEQKALLTGLVLAHAQLVADVSGHVPILLLDEIAAHLDHHRREALFDLIGMLGAQAWMTGTDAPLFEALGERAQRFIVHAGTVEESKGP